MKKEITFMLAVTVFGLIGVVYADSYEETVRIPIPDNAVKTLDRCTLVEKTDNAVRFNCAWEFEAENVEKWYEELTGQSPEDVTETQETVEEPTPIGKISEVTPDNLKPYVQDLERFEDRPPKTESDKEYYELLKYLAECQRGYNESYGIQQSDSFAISQTWINENEAWIKAIDLTGRHGELRKNIEACIAQRTILNPVTLGQEALHKGEYYGINQKHHSEVTTIQREDSQFIAKFAVYDKLSDKDFEHEEQEAQNTLCNIAASFRLDYCNKSELIDVGGVVSFQNDAEDKWLQYQSDNGKQMAKELAKEKLLEKQKQLLDVMRLNQ